MAQQHYRLTIEDAKSLYQSREITAIAALKFWIRINLKPEWKRKINPLEIQALFKMPKSTFWRSLAKLKESGEIDFQEREIEVTRLINKTESHQWDSSPTHGIAVPLMGQESHSWDEQPLEPLPENSPSLSSYSSQITYKSLSEKERENFLIFSRKKAASLPTPPTLVERWIESQFDTLCTEYQEYQRRETANRNAVSLSTDLSQEPDIDPRIVTALGDGEILEIDHTYKTFKDILGWIYDWSRFEEWATRDKSKDLPKSECFRRFNPIVSSGGIA